MATQLTEEQKAALKTAYADLDETTRREVMGEPPAAPPVDVEAITKAATDATLAAIKADREAETKAAEVAAKAKADEEDAAFKAEQAAAAKMGAPFKPNQGEEDPEPGHATQRLSFHIVEQERKSLKDLLFCKADEMGDYKSVTEDFQSWNDRLLLSSRILHRAGAPRSVHELPLYDRFWGSKGFQGDMRKALYTGGTGVGSEWTPTEFSTQWLELVKESGKLLPLFRTLPMNTKTETFPIFAGRSGTMYVQGEAAVDDPVKYRAANVTSAQLSLTAYKFALRTVISQEYTEDTVAGAMDYTRQDLSNTAAFGLDEAILDGDTSATHQDTGYTMGSDDRRKFFSGLRFAAQSTFSAANVSGVGVTWSQANNLVSAVSKMGIYAGDNPVMVISRGLGWKLGLVRDGANNLIPSPNVASNGPPASWLGLRVVATDAVLDTYTSAGIYDGSTTTYTLALFVNPEAYYTGWRRGWTVDTTFDPATGVYELVMTCRLAFGTPYTTATHYIANQVDGILASW